MNNVQTTTPTSIRAVPRSVMQAVTAVGLLAAGAFAATLVMQRPAPSTSPPSMPSATPTSTAPATAAPLAALGTPGQPAKDARGTGSHAAGSRQTAPAGGSQGTALDTAPAVAQSVCTHCGVVESVARETRKGQGTGLGAVAGGVLGGVVGNQMGKGDGRKAMTVLGAVGGGLAGNEVEKRQRATTVYKVTVRMDDGSRRTLTRNEPVAAGQRVTVEGSRLHIASGTRSAPPPAKTLQTRNLES